MTKIIYHGNNCNDGFTSAIVAYQALVQDCQENGLAMKGMNPSDPFPWDWIKEGDKVYILDISFKRPDLLKLKEIASFVIVLDHHETAEKELAGLDFCKFDMQKSGAMLTWEYFYPKDTPPNLVKYVEDRDLWRFRYTATQYCHMGLTCIPKLVDTWLPLLGHEEELDKVCKQGEAVTQYSNSLIGLICKKAYYTNLGDIPVVAVNSAIYQSELGNHLLEQAVNAHIHYAIVWNVMKDKTVYSLRSRNTEDFNCADLAKKYGGGGHKHAAGFTVDMTNGGKLLLV